MASYLGRRKFLATLGGAAVAWPVAARAQQPAMPVIGLLDISTPSSRSTAMAGFRRGLTKLATSKAKTSQSNIVGRKVISIGSLHWPPTWLTVRWS
jgi:hypothetical protein